MESTSANRKDYITVLNVLSCFSVVMLHCNGIIWTRPEGRLWISANFIETFFYFAVPIFFMISGVTLLDYPTRYSTKEYFHKRFEKTVLPFFAWSIIGLLYRLRQTVLSGGVFDFNPLHVLSRIFNTEYISIYWFFIPLFSVYLTIPVLAHVQDKLKVFRYASVVGLLFLSILPLVFSLLSISYNNGLIPSVVNGYILFSLLGYFLANTALARKQELTIYFLGILGWLLMFGGTLWLSAPGEINSTFKGYLNIPAVLQACAVFVFVKHHPLPPPREICFPG